MKYTRMTRLILNKLISWTTIKYRLILLEDKHIPYFHEKEIWWCSIGSNIGFEQEGKNSNFERPVFIIKKFNRHMMWVLPLTSKIKITPYHFPVSYKGKQSTVILSQLRTISSKRLLRKVGKISDKDFKDVRERVAAFIKNDLSPK